MKSIYNLIIFILILTSIVGCGNKGDKSSTGINEPESADSNQQVKHQLSKAEKKKREEIKAKVEAMKNKIEFIEVGVKHMKYKNFSEKYKVKLDEDMELGDSDYVAVVVDFNPDFVMDRKTKEVASRSADFNNPAIKIELYKGDDLVYDTWIIYNFPSYHRVRAPGFIFSFLNAKIGGRLLSDVLPQETKGPIARLSRKKESKVEGKRKKGEASAKQKTRESGNDKNTQATNQE